jgi:hypothetical protein
MIHDAVEMRLKGEIVLALTARAPGFANDALNGAGLDTNATTGGLKDQQVVRLNPGKAPSCTFPAGGRIIYEGL